MLNPATQSATSFPALIGLPLLTNAAAGAALTEALNVDTTTDAEAEADEIFCAIKALIQQRVALTEEQATTCTLWAVLTWFQDVANVLPILNLTSPAPRCGKTTLLSVLQGLVNKPISAANITPSALFHVISEQRPTLLIDEVDTFLSKNKEMRGILNSGHTKASAFVWRMTKLGAEQFSTWGPKLLAGIGEIEDTLRDRSIIIQLRRKPAGLSPASCPDPLPGPANLHARLLKWSEQNRQRYCDQNPVPYTLENDRASDNWLPLQKVAMMAGERWGLYCARAATEINSVDAPDDGHSTMALLKLIKRVLQRQPERRRFPTSLLIKAITSEEDGPWHNATPQHRLSVHNFARALRPFGVRPVGIRLDSGTTLRGYKREDLEGVLGCYLKDEDDLIVDD